jgi:hypothetical protein
MKFNNQYRDWETGIAYMYPSPKCPLGSQWQTEEHYTIPDYIPKLVW